MNILLRTYLSSLFLILSLFTLTTLKYLQNSFGAYLGNPFYTSDWASNRIVSPYYKFLLFFILLSWIMFTILSFIHSYKSFNHKTSIQLFTQSVGVLSIPALPMIASYLIHLRFSYQDISISAFPNIVLGYTLFFYMSCVLLMFLNIIYGILSSVFFYHITDQKNRSEEQKYYITGLFFIASIIYLFYITLSNPINPIQILRSQPNQLPEDQIQAIWIYTMTIFTCFYVCILSGTTLFSHLLNQYLSATPKPLSRFLTAGSRLGLPALITFPIFYTLSNYVSKPSSILMVMVNITFIIIFFAVTGNSILRLSRNNPTEFPKTILFAFMTIFSGLILFS